MLLLEADLPCHKLFWSGSPTNQGLIALLVEAQLDFQQGL